MYQLRDTKQAQILQSARHYNVIFHIIVEYPVNSYPVEEKLGICKCNSKRLRPTDD